MKVEHVVQRFRETLALKDVSLDIRPGELLALLGPSGSGKTTLLRILAGLDQPTGGRVTFDGEDALGLPVQERNVGLVFQNYALFRHMTVLGNVAFGLKVRPREQRPSARPRFASARSISSSSCSSMVSKSAIRRSSPADSASASPSPARSPSSRACCSSTSRSARSMHKCEKSCAAGCIEIHKETGHTTVFVTHDQEEALELADRVVVMRDGRSSRSARPTRSTTSRTRPSCSPSSANRARFPCGSMQASSGSTSIRSIFLPATCPNGPARLFLRPHDVELVDDMRGAIPGVISFLRRQGGSRRLDLEVNGHGDRIEIEVPANFAHVSGEVAIRPRRFRVYPALA